MTKLSHSTSIVIDDLDKLEANNDDDVPEVILVNPTNIPVLSETSFTNNNDDDEVVCNDADTETQDDHSEDDDDYDSDEAEKQIALNRETQQILLKTFEDFYRQESESMLGILSQSRNEIKDSMVDLMEEQHEHKEELNKVTEGRYSNVRKKENSIPLAVYLRRKRGDTPGSSTTASMSSGLDNISNSSASLYVKQHPSERLAVEKYMKKRERQKVAESNRINREKTSSELTTEMDRILSGIQGTEVVKEKERDRQMERIQSKLKSARTPVKKDQEVVNEILENYNETSLAFEREKQQQQKRFQRILSAKNAGKNVPEPIVAEVDI